MSVQLISNCTLASYSNAVSAASKLEELGRIKDCALAANHFSLHVNAGHGLNYQNVSEIAHLNYIEELNIGHSIVSRAALVGMDQAVRDMVRLIS